MNVDQGSVPTGGSWVHPVMVEISVTGEAHDDFDGHFPGLYAVKIDPALPDILWADVARSALCVGPASTGHPNFVSPSWPRTVRWRRLATLPALASRPAPSCSSN